MKTDSLAPEILYEDSHLVVVNKPAGILTIPDRWNKTKISLLGTMRETLSSSLRLVHRLDKETSGLILFAKDLESQREISRQFQTHAVTKTYYALVEGELAEKSGRIEQPIAEDPLRPGKTEVAGKRGKPSLTLYGVLEKFRGFTLLLVKPLSGRTHQVRVHLASIGYPLAVDQFYGHRQALYLSELKPGYKRKEEGEKPLIDRLTLHAVGLRFRNLDGREITVESPLPKDFQVTLKQLRKFRGLPGKPQKEF